MRELLKVLKAAGDESRLRILNILRLRPLCVCEIAEVLGLAQSTISRHLKILEDCGLLERAKDGLWVEYRRALAPEGSLQHGVFSMVEQALNGTEAARADEEKSRCVDRHTICSKTG